jgi:MYXO-CTERM domain-containing protein
MNTRIDWVVILAAIGSALGCSGGGCDGMVPTPGGFPAAERTANAGQIRISQSGVAAVTSDPEALLGGLLGGGGLTFDVPPGCGGSPAICCPGGTPQTPCGPIVIDLHEEPGDPPRMEVHPVANQSRLDVIVRARITTASDLPVDDIPLIGDCTVAIDTEPGSDPDVRIDLPISFVQDATAGTTRVETGDAALSQLTADDVSINGGGLCFLADLGVGLFIDTLSSQFTDQISGAIGGQLCKQCASGDVAECGQFAAACTDNTCMKADDTCLQELGITGRAIGNKMLGSLSPGTLGGFDVYEVAGGYATTNQNGIALGLLGGMLPAGAERDRCGPPATAPAPVTIPESTYFRGNTRPDTGAPFDLAIGLHQSQLEEFAYAAYEGGFLCLTVSTRTIDLLTSDTLTLVAPSLSDIVTETSPVAVGLRPQTPPTIVLGLNTFRDEGGEQVVDEALLDITFTAMEIDFFTSVDGHYFRLFTLVSDVHLPIGLQVADGELVPVIGSADDAFTNLSVKNSDALTDSPADLAARFPSILALALPQLGAGLGSFALPALGGLNLEVTDITAVDNKAFLAIFSNLTIATAARVDTTADLISIDEPDAAVLDDPSAWGRDNRPAARLHLIGDGLEWQLRTDGGMWTPWSSKPDRTVSPRSFWVQGTHTIEVRAREIGKAGTIDPTPLVLQVPIGSIPRPGGDKISEFHGQAGESGCDCSTGDASGGVPIALALLGLLWPRSRKARKPGLPRWLWVAAVIVALGAAPGCSCSNSSAPCGEVECMEGEVPHSSGKFNGAATDGTRTVVSSYDPQLGDLVIAEVAGAEYTLSVVDGVPVGDTPQFDPATYRGGISGPGPNVGRWSSVALSAGQARIAYEDDDTGAIKVAAELDGGGWSIGQVDDRGTQTSIAIDAGSKPVVAYLVTDVRDGSGGVTSELRIARSSNVAPSTGDWTPVTVASAPASCAGACDNGQACIVSAGGPETCVTPTSDCPATCSDTEVCSAAACIEMVPDPAFTDLPTGTGLFPTVLVLSDGRLAVVFYDRTRTALILALESSAGAGTFAETILDGAGDDDRGMWASAVSDGTTIHVAYQDALGDQVFYTSWSGGTVGPVELVDDGVRAGDRTHPVGTGAAVFLANGAPAIAYQDGLTSDIEVAHRGGGTWTHATLSGGAPLDGFHIAATANVIAWDQLSHDRSPADRLVTAPAP